MGDRLCCRWDSKERRGAMRTLFIGRRAVSVRRESEHLVVVNHAEGVDAVPQRVPLKEIERVVVVGEPSISFQVLVYFMKHAVPCSFLSAGGRWLGALAMCENHDAPRRMMQYRCLEDAEHMLRIAKRLVVAKVTNEIRVLQRLMYAEPRHPKPEGSAWGTLQSCVHWIDGIMSASKLRGVEGMAARLYFEILKTYFPADMPFEGRNRHPPKDPVNAALSFAYALVQYELDAVIRSHGLDASVGVLHTTSGRFPALTLDLMEPFRPAIADRLILNLCRTRRLRAMEHFEAVADGGVHLNEAGRAVLLPAFEEMMQTPFRDGDSGHMTDFRQVFQATVATFIQCLQSDAAPAFFRLN